MTEIIRKIKKSIAIKGFMGTVKQGIEFIIRRFKMLLPSYRQERNAALMREMAFDRQWGVDTSGMSVPDEAEVVGGNWKYGNKYQGCDPEIVAQTLEDLAIDYSDFTFIDIGSGKGRALLLASRYPFKKIIGVEFSQQLSDVAARNVEVFPNSEKRCLDIETICDDATQYRLPDGSLVLFLYNPFGKQVMERFVDNVSASYWERPRRIVVIYMTSYFADVWQKVDFLREVRSDWISIYDTKTNKI